MRGSKPLHAILSYRETGPSASASAGVNQRFLQHLKNGSTFIKAWKAAHNVGDQPGRWAALCYEASVDDTLLHWARHGELPSHPDPKGTILYFDKDTPSGKAVKEMKPDVDCWLTAPGSSARIPPWFLCAKHGEYDLHIRLLTPGENFQPGDRILIAAAQVRVDYARPFSIGNLFTIKGEDLLQNQGLLVTDRVIHQNPGFGADSYELVCRPGPGLPFRIIGPELVLPIEMGEAENNHIPLYYFNIAVEGIGARRYGFKRTMQGKDLWDAFQFGMFLLPWRT
jgi:hypothetical protein